MKGNGMSKELIQRLRSTKVFGSTLYAEAAAEIERLQAEVDKQKAVLKELVDAIDARWAGETDRKRANAISPRMEDAIDAARAKMGERRESNESI